MTAQPNMNASALQKTEWTDEALTIDKVTVFKQSSPSGYDLRSRNKNRNRDRWEHLHVVEMLCRGQPSPRRTDDTLLDSTPTIRGTMCYEVTTAGRVASHQHGSIDDLLSRYCM